MTVIAVNPAELLFSNAEGKPTSLEDLIDDGSTARIAVAFPR